VKSVVLQSQHCVCKT